MTEMSHEVCCCTTELPKSCSSFFVILGSVYLGAKGTQVRLSPSTVFDTAFVLIVEWKVVFIKLLPELLVFSK